MSMPAVHLNLLRDAERRSSSPVRLKIILPIAFGVVLLALLGWWGFIEFQLGMIGAEARRLKSEITGNQTSYAEVCKLRDALGAREAELGQLTGYRRARRTWGETLAALATRMPLGVQLTSIEIPEPPAQRLQPPPGLKVPPLLGPTGTLERVVFRIAGRTAREETLIAFLKTVKSSPDFTNNLVIVERGGGELSPRMRQFGQDAVVDAQGNRAIVFDVEYATPGRDFAP